MNDYNQGYIDALNELMQKAQTQKASVDESFLEGLITQDAQKIMALAYQDFLNLVDTQLQGANKE